jgi:hypothetical protein
VLKTRNGHRPIPYCSYRRQRPIRAPTAERLAASKRAVKHSRLHCQRLSPQSVGWPHVASVSAFHQTRGKGTGGMADHRMPSQPHQSMFLGLRERARIKRGNDALVRVCMIAFGVAIAAIAPVNWGWKIALFLAIMSLVGIIMPAISRGRRNPY